MLIIAKKKDYYDGVAGTTGIDKTIIYDRETVELEDDNMPKIFKRNKRFGWKNRENPFLALNYHQLKKEYQDVCDEHAYFIIGFCGKLYIGWKLYLAQTKYPHEVNIVITYDTEYMKDILEEKSFHGILADSLNYIQTYNALSIFRELNTPAMVYDSDYGRVYFDKKCYNNHHPKFFVNPLLKDYEFYKVFDTFQAFQEVSMFMGGVLGNKEKEIVVVADKYKIEQHGFDYKWSFRKEPQEKKK
jgi:hypothetical protein